MLRKIAALTTITIGICRAGCAEPADPIRFEPAGRLAIKGDIGVPALSATVLVTVSDSDTKSIRIVSRPLSGQTGLPPIEIDPVADQHVERGLPAAVKISVSHIEKPGNYGGEIEVYSIDSRKLLGKLSLDVTAERVPVLTPPTLVTATFVRCGASSRLCNWLADIFVPQRNRTPANTVVVSLTNGVPGSTVDFEAPSLRAQGAVTGNVANPAAVRADPPHSTQDANVQVTLAVDASELPADRYNGTLFLRLKNAASLITVPFEIAVRSGPIVPMILILVGILAGILSRWMDTYGNQIADLIARLDRIERRIPSDDFDAMRLELDEVRNRIDDYDLAGASGAIADLELRARYLSELAAIANNVDPADHATLDAIEAERRVLRTQSDPNAAQVIAKLRQAIAPKAKPGVQDFAAEQPEKRKYPQLPEGFSLRLRHFAVSSTPYLRMLLRATATVALAIIGMYTLYGGNPVFGAIPVNDYLGAFLWGLGSDVAGKTLSNVGGLLPKRA